MNNQDYALNVVNSLYGGNLFKLSFDDMLTKCMYNITIRLFEQENIAAASIRKNEILIYRCQNERMIVLGELISFCENNNINNISNIQDKLMEILL
jgi:hypothetical protein